MSALGKGLGRGFDSLIPQNFDNSLLLNEDERVQKLPLDKLQPRHDQPRQHFDDGALKELAASIKNHGILLPLVVVAEGNMYRIIAGERRWRAATLAKLQTVPAIVRTLQELEQLEIALVENVQRVDLSPLEQAVSIEKLHREFNVSYEQIASRLGKAISTVNNTVRLLQLPETAQQALRDKKITEGHARALLALKGDAEKVKELLDLILKHKWSVREAERYVTSHKAGVRDTKAVKERVSTETPATKQLSKRFEAPVHIRRTAKGGRLEISFRSDDELDRIIKLLG